jgi:hypothetical protein
MTLIDDHAGSGAQDAAIAASGRETASSAFTRMLTIAAVASIVAGIIHAGAVASHSDHRAAVWTFLITTVIQVAWGAYALARPQRWVAVVGVVIGGLAVAGWVVAKADGIGFINGLDDKEPIQLADGLCALLAAITMTASALALLGRRLLLPRVVVAVVSAVILVAAAPGTVAALNHEHTHAEAASAVPPHPYDPKSPIDLSGVPGVTPQEQARAENLLAATVLLLPQWADPAYDEAHGFYSIGDGRSGSEHYVNLTYINDSVMLDPDRPESLVFDTTVTPKRLVAAMYMGTPGMTLAQVPDIGGPLTQWHIHNNLCFNGEGRIAGLVQPDGSCPRPLIKGPETPMIHVWIIPHSCGPFAALEGNGGGQVAPEQAVACDHVHGT